jgi:hypothetical protein
MAARSGLPRRPFCSSGSIITRKSGASARSEVSWQGITDACVWGNASLSTAARSRRRFPKGTLEMRPNQSSVMVTLPEVANHHRAVLFISPPSNREQTIGADWNLGQGCGI